MKPWRAVSLILLALAVATAGYGLILVRRGFSALATPSAIEEFAATTARKIAVPSASRQLRNPITPSTGNIRGGMEHFSYHCASCHSNNGGGHTVFGKGLYLARHAAQFGTITGPVTTDMVKVRQPKCDMVEREIAGNLAPFKSSGAELVMGSGNFVAPKTLDVQLNAGGTRRLTGDKVFIDVGSHAAMPSIPAPLERDGQYWRQV